MSDDAYSYGDEVADMVLALLIRIRAKQYPSDGHPRIRPGRRCTRRTPPSFTERRQSATLAPKL